MYRKLALSKVENLKMTLDIPYVKKWSRLGNTREPLVIVEFKSVYPCK